MSPQSPERTSPKPYNQSLLDTVLEPEFTAVTLFSGPLGFEYPQHIRSNDQSSKVTAIEGAESKPWGSLGDSVSSIDMAAGYDDFPCNEIYQQQIYLTDSENHDKQSTSSLGKTSNSESLRPHISQLQKEPTEMMEGGYTQFVPSPPPTPPGIDEYFRNRKTAQTDVQKRVLAPVTAVSTLSSFSRPQGPHPNGQLSYVPNFSRPFSRLNPPAVQNAVWRLRMRGRGILDDARPGLVGRYLCGKFDEQLLARKIEVLRKEVEMIDGRSGEWRKAVDMLEEVELRMALEMSLEMKEDEDDYASLDFVKVV